MDYGGIWIINLPFQTAASSILLTYFYMLLFFIVKMLVIFKQNTIVIQSVQCENMERDIYVKEKRHDSL